MLRLFDVTLRDGLQSVSKIYNLDEKKQILDKIIIKNPQAIEIGSIVSPKILPQMKNSIELYKYANEYNCYVNKPIDFYMLTPNLKSLEIASLNKVENFSLITSVSDAFQQKNINKTLVETKCEIRRMMENIETTPGKKKLYISCINKCPIQGKINHIRIVDEIIYYYYIYENLDEICLSDTCGTLSYSDFKEIIIGLEKRQISLDKFSLHLHNQGDGTNNNKNNNVREIVLYAMKKGIYRFDVSNMPELGGCIVTMKNPTGNLSYEQIYENLTS
jgi:hydroxymethylglutaryl-CoA lyase